jgi:tripartite-type tricarboxylate transporter receptor subunit TctC
MPGFPDVPTLKELGYTDLAVNAWFGFAAPAGVPAAIVTRMNREIDIALDHPSVRKHLDAQGFEVAKMSPSELTAFIVEQIAKWGPLARRLANPK